MKKLTAVLLLSVFLLLCGCEPISQQLTDTTLPTNSSGDVIERSFETEESEDENETVAFTEYVAEVPEIENAEANEIIEAEDCKLSGSLYKSNTRKGFSGEGYVTGFYGGSADFIDIPFEFDINQHYDITICVASDVKVTNSLEVNGSKLHEFTINGDGKFTKITFYGVYMKKGENKITIKSGNENFDFDFIEVINSETIYETEFELSENASNKNSSSETEILLKFMKQSFGKKIITGQYASSDENKELELIHKTTGKYPAIRFGDIGGYSNSSRPSQSEIDAAIDWSEKGGIVGFMWYWNSPVKENSSVYTKDTTFRLKAAVTKQDIAEKSMSEISELYKKGLVTLECVELVKNIDAVSNMLAMLAEEDIPVLWRPLHEAGGDWFWWGADGAVSYKWLYNLMYDRMTKYHKLDNLIWVWNGQSEEYLVDEDKYDIAAIDIYLSPEINYGSRSEQYLWLKKITDSGKLLAISECSSIPSIDDMSRDNSLWSFFGLWFGDYLTDPKGKLSEIYTKKEEFIKMYNAENAITLENFSSGNTN